MPPQLWETAWGSCGAGPGLSAGEEGTSWSHGEVAVEGMPWSLLGLSAISGQRYTSMGPLVLFKWSWKLSLGESKAQGNTQRGTQTHPTALNSCGIQAGHCNPKTTSSRSNSPMETPQNHPGPFWAAPSGCSR